MLILIYSLPFIIAVLLLIFFRKQVTWFEYIGLIVFSIIFTLIFKSIFITINESDTEYWGSYMTKIRHYDDWDEWVHRTCTRKVLKGHDKDGNPEYEEEKYDCSYRDYHPERWTYTDNYGSEHYFYNKAEFDRAMAELGHPKMVFVDMHRHYYTKDGDAQDYYWDGTFENSRTLTTWHTYTNKVIASRSIFRFEDIDKNKAKELGLFEYPEIQDYDQKSLLGVRLDRLTEKKIKYLNATFGSRYQFRMYILVFKDKPLVISEQQKSYWQGGNKNEFVLCLGYNTKTHKIDWCNPFSWCDSPKLEVATKRYFREHPTLNLMGYCKWLEQNIKLWKRKEFKDFDYIDVEMSDGQTVALFIIILLLDIGMSIFLIGNEYINENIYKSDGNFKWSLSIEDYEKLLEKINDKLTTLVDKFKKIRYYV